jgi:LacI family repressor for deo operon, udp, cdd, tsx, nupC, and nupG
MLATGTFEPDLVARKATGLDVARLAGVSQSAVSLVLNGGGRRHGLTQATEARVLSAAAKLGYVPNHAARSLRRRRTNVITFMTSELGNPYFAEVAAAAQQAALLRGYVIDMMAPGAEVAEIGALTRLGGGGISDGLVIHSGSDQISKELRFLSDRGIGCVLLQDAGQDTSIPCVRVDLQEGARLATRHLLALGHRRVAHVTDVRLASQRRNDRLAGYCQALAEAGVAFDATLIAQGDNTPAGGAAAMRALLARPGAPPSAVFVFNDQMAVGGLHALRTLGIRVPQDMAVVGFDGISLGAFTSPELTTIDHPRQDLGRLATDTLIDLLEGARPATATRTLPVRLVVRGSCGAVT